ncbi:MAG: Rpn family recombination-promoting nuclease/putative transposase [Bacillus sp. (in: Bacteria)]|nr:Rpn family recombination-promoting nuclease/putative transposase [Bacillus sp. (in: firmicutes)]MCM1427251.1 Rpn family recombination-promoting nuclease/putative transposase [Eubacterium sp.]
MKLISLKNDYAFKELFTHENVRKQFISDVLGIRMEHIKSVRLTTPFLWKRYRMQKLGIMDLALNIKLAEDAKAGIEMQVRVQKNWTKRTLFYLAKMYTDDLRSGQDYDRLRKCISISILDFDLVDSDEYHTIYRLRDKNGKDLTDLFEVHIIELGKTLNGAGSVDDWIRLFNAENEEDLKMIKSKSAGINEAIRELKTMSLGKTLRYMYEEHLKAIRDRRAEDEYVHDMGKAEGRAESIIQLLMDLGDVSEELSAKIMSEKDLDTLKRWLAMAAKVESIQQFETELENRQQ